MTMDIVHISYRRGFYIEALRKAMAKHGKLEIFNTDIL